MGAPPCAKTQKQYDIMLHTMSRKDYDYKFESVKRFQCKVELISEAVMSSRYSAEKVAKYTIIVLAVPNYSYHNLERIRN